MTNILLCGIPGVGKTDLATKCMQDSNTLIEKDIRLISLGDIVAEEARRLWNTESSRRPFIDFAYQEILRSYAIAEASRLLLQSPQEHNIIDTPMTMYLSGEVPNILFNHTKISTIDQACRGPNSENGLNAVVTVIDDAETISKNLASTPYPRDLDKILDWIAYEINSARAVTPVTAKTLVIPKLHSDDTLTKLILNPNCPVGYFAFPIRSLQINADDSRSEKKKKNAAQLRIEKFRDKLQEYTALLVPMIISDARESSIPEIRNTEHRDLHLFIKYSDFTIAFFPDEKYRSSGVPDELKQAKKTGGYVILIHPDKKYKSTAFGVVPDIYCRNEEEFFSLVLNSRDSKFDGKPEQYLRRFLMTEQNLPLYATLKPQVVAIDFINEEGKHLLIKQPKNKPFAGYWTLVAGKKKGNETDYKAIARESLEEVGLIVHRLDSNNPWFHPTDYAENFAVKYVRFYRCSSQNFAGRTSPNHIVEKEEVAAAVWLTADEIRKSRKLILPATKEYFKANKNI